jgi:hypothetical protein
MFDVVALNDLEIDSFDLNMDNGVTADVEVYTKTGSYVGSDMTPGDWTLIASVAGVVSAGEGLPTPLGLDLNISVTSGNMQAFYVTLTNSTGINYTNGGTVGDLFAADANLEFYEGVGKVYPFLNTFSPRIFNGNIVYELPGGLTPVSSLTLTCAEVGVNDITLFVTDDSGLVSTCVAEVTVEDNMAPVIDCVGAAVDDDIMVNGSFETGDFTGWTVEDFTNPFFPYSVVPSFDPGFGLGEATPTDGGFLAANGFDAGDPEEALLYQDVTIPAGATATLTWDENIDYDMMSFCAGCLDRLYEVQVRDLSGTVLETLQTVIGVGGTIEADNAWESLSADLSAYAGQDVRITFWQNIPEAFTGPGKFALDNVVLQVVVTSSPPLSVDLDANGMATIDVTNLVSVTDNCGWTATVGDAPMPGSLATLFDGGNGQSGNMFDINALETVTIDSFDIHLVAGTTDDIEVYFKPGTFVGSEGDASAWTLLATAAGITSAGDNTPTPLGLSLGQTIAAGDTGAFYVTTTLGGTMAYTNGTTQGAIFASDANIEFLEGDGVVYPFAGNFSPRVFNGNILYTAGDGPMTTLDVDCSMLGANSIEITVTDDSGNASVCSTTVNVFDVTDPILICMDVTIELGPDGTAEVDPAALLAVAPSTFEAMVIGSDNQSGTAGTTDFTVDVTAAETVSFDWMYTTNDDPGFDSFGYVLNGTYTQLTDNAVGNQSGTGSVAVAPGDVFGFRSVTDDNGFGNNETLVTNFLPGFDGQFEPANWTVTLDNSDGDAFFVEIPGGPLSFDACGITVLAVDVTDVSCADIGTPITAMVFASDASGNIAACNSIITVVDALAPEVTCPADQTVDPGPGNLFYEVPDYFATGEATASDNCTDPLTILSQTPAAGDLISDGVYTVTITAEDEYGNVGTCTFELTVESVLGLDDNVLDSSITMFPNPANASVTLSNTSNIALEKAAIYDTNGRLINTIDLSTMQQEKVIDVSALATGVYMVQIQSENASTVKRLVKE